MTVRVIAVILVHGALKIFIRIIERGTTFYSTVNGIVPNESTEMLHLIHRLVRSFFPILFFVVFLRHLFIVTPRNSRFLP